MKTGAVNNSRETKLANFVYRGETKLSKQTTNKQNWLTRENPQTHELECVMNTEKTAPSQLTEAERER